ncbi:MAG TPA: non-homologous end-joining DNA ligase [Euzebyales bacterium]
MSADSRPGLTSPDKLLWPDAGITKADLWDYYSAAHDRLLRAVADRPLTLKRHPNGIHRSGFVQKHLGDDVPEDLHRFTTWSASSERDVSYLVIAGRRELQWAAQMAVVELHAWLSTTDRPDRPDSLLFDLDPSGDDPPVATVALRLRELLDELGLAARVKSSGKRGLHVVVRVERRYGFTELRGFALALARCLADRHPDQLTVEMRKADRGRRLLIDWSRHGQGQHTVAAWSPRVTPEATVSAPLTWDEVADGIDPHTITVGTALDRPDHWAEPAPAHRIEQARDRLERWGYPAVDRSPRARTTT